MWAKGGQRGSYRGGRVEIKPIPIGKLGGEIEGDNLIGGKRRTKAKWNDRKHKALYTCSDTM